VTLYRPGSFFLTTINGPAGFGIGLGQALAGSPSRYEHAGLIVDVDGTTVEAEPGGARIAHLSDYAGRPLLISDGPVQSYLRQLQALDNVPELLVRQRIIAAAQSLRGVPYSPTDYVALALLYLHMPSGWIRRRVQSSGHMICSQLVDAVYQRAGIHLFDDGRLPGDVMPADLAAWAEDWQAAQTASTTTGGQR
jgi:hypothetical protein